MTIAYNEDHSSTMADKLTVALYIAKTSRTLMCRRRQELGPL